MATTVWPDAGVLQACASRRTDPPPLPVIPPDSSGFSLSGCGIAVALPGWRGSRHIAKEDVVRKWIAVPIAVFLIAGAGRAQAQETTPGPGVVEVTVIPAGVGFISSKNNAPSFGNYGFGFATTYNINSVIGIEGELAALIATTSDLQFGDLNNHIKAPNFLNYNVNAIVTAVRLGPSALYAAGGIGGLTMFERVGLGVADDNTFFVGNVGGGIKWYAPNSRWGLRGDYRFLMTKSSDSAPVFFGQNTRYAHKLYAGVILNVK